MQLAQRVLALPAVQQIMAQTKFSLDIKARGQLVRVVGLTLEAQGCRVAIGDHCLVGNPGQQIETEVIGFSGMSVYLMPISSVSNLSQLEPGAMVVPSAGSNQISVGDGYLGRVIGGDGSPLDSLPLPEAAVKIPLQRPPINPLLRQPIKQSLDVGVRSINALLSVGQGQRMGLFAGSGVGKSVLLGMMTRFTDADVCVVALVGERGREVKEFIDDILGPSGMAKAVVIASPADDAPLVRLRAALRATAFAEYFRDQGKKVLLLMDSLTRFAQAQREIALASGEPPASKGYPPSVFSKLPALVERAGNGDGQGQGSITAFYTVLTEGDDQQDPIADAARAILDGHVVLSRSLAEAGHYPAVDVEASISRAMPAVVKESHLLSSQRFKQLYAHYQQNLDLINVGAYSAGNDPDLDYAIANMPNMKAFLQQGLFDQADFVSSREALGKCISVSAQPASPS